MKNSGQEIEEVQERNQGEKKSYRVDDSFKLQEPYRELCN